MATVKNSAVRNTAAQNSAGQYPNEEFQSIYDAIMESSSGSGANPYPSMMTFDEFQTLYDNIRAGMGDDDALMANLEAAMRPGLEQSIAQLQQRRRENNASIDVDSASRGMGTSSWVTDAKLQNLRNVENNIAALDANYNANLYNYLINAIGQRDQNAYNQAANWMNAYNQDLINRWNAQQQSQQSAYSQAMQWWQILHPYGIGGGSGSGSASPQALPVPEITASHVPATGFGTHSQLHQYLTDAMNVERPSSTDPGRASVNPWNLNLLRPGAGQYTR